MVQCKVKPHGDVGAGEVSPAEEVDEPVEAGQFTSRLFLALHHGAGLGGEKIVYGGHHSQTCGGKITASEFKLRHNHDVFLRRFYPKTLRAGMFNLCVCVRV